MNDFRSETDSLGKVDVPADKLWGAQTQRSLEHFSIGADLMPREMIAACATLKKAAANANHDGGRLEGRPRCSSALSRRRSSTASSTQPRWSTHTLLPTSSGHEGSLPKRVAA